MRKPERLGNGRGTRGTWAPRSPQPACCAPGIAAVTIPLPSPFASAVAVSELAGDAGQERGGGGLLVGGGSVAGPEADRYDAGRHEVKAVEEALDLFQGVDVDPGGGVLRGEVRALGGVAGADGDDQVTAGDDGAGEGGGHVAGGGGLREVQDAGEDDTDGVGQVDQVRQAWIGQDAGGVAHVAGHGDHAGALGQQAAGVRDDDRVVVHVRDPHIRVDAPSDVVGVHRGGQARADIDELPDPATGYVADGPPEEPPVLPGHLRGGRVNGQHLLGQLAVDGEVILAAEPVVPDAGDVRLGRVEWLHRCASHHVLRSVMVSVAAW